jgi:hypothetical protein
MNLLNITLVISLLTVSGVALAAPRTLIRNNPAPIIQPQDNKCAINPMTWEIPLGTSEVTISYLNKKGKVLFERDFSVTGGNKIKLRARSNNGNSEN